jgi:tetratricopeptide (TPR) repeat protein
VREALVAAHPNDVVFRRMLMIGYGHVAAILGNPFVYNLGDSEGAREYYGKALAIAKDISKRDSQDRTAQYDLASALLRLGAIDAPADRSAVSLAMLRKASEILVPLAKADPKMLRYKRTLSVAYEYAGRRLNEMGRPNEALAEFRRSLEVAEGILATNPDDPSTRTEALVNVAAIANVLAEKGDRAGALTYARQGIGRAEQYLATGPDRELGGPRIPKSYFALASVYRSLAKVEARTAAQRVADWRDAHAAAERAVSEWRKLTAGAEKHPYAREIAKAEALLAECKAHR